LLVLPAGNLYEYRCVHCGTSTGTKTEKDQKDARILFGPG
jgi:DNA-directed RNA polymerase subunit RPC12/RpoP